MRTECRMMRVELGGISMWKIFITVVLANTILLGSPVYGAECSQKGNSDRRYVKTSVPANADLGMATPFALDRFLQMPNPQINMETKQQLETTPVRLTLRGQLVEGKIVFTEGMLVHASCEADDGDYHLQLALPSGSGGCLIVEVPDPVFLAPRNPLRQISANVRQAVRNIYGGSKPNGAPPRSVIIHVEGQLFFDAHHYSFNKPRGGDGGGRGKAGCAAANLWEIHPITELHVVP